MTGQVTFGSQPYTYTIAPDAVVSIKALGSMVRVTAATADFKLGFNRQSRGRWFVGKAYRTPPGFTFESVELENDGVASITVTVEITLGDIINDRLVLDPGAEVTPRGDLAALVEAPGYTGGLSRGGVTGQLTEIQLFNPAVSGVLLECDRTLLKVAVGTRVFLRRHDAQIGSAGGAHVDPLDFRASVGVGEVTSRNDLTGSGAELYRLSMSAGVEREFSLPVPIKVSPGTGLIAQTGSANSTLDVFFDWREIPL